MRADTLQVVWHSTDDKIQPIFSVDFHRDGTLATAGGDHDIRLWKVLTTKDGKTAVKHLSTLKNHASSVNAIRFSPYGDLLASAGDAGELLLWKPRGGEALVAAAPSFGADEEEEGSWKYSTTLRGHSSDIYDLAWSPDATALLSGSVENIALLWDVKSGKGKARLQDHKHFIQGVAWDPVGEMLVTQSADRSCRVYGPRPPAVGKKGGGAVKDASAVARVSELCCQAVLSKVRVAPGAGAVEGDKPVFDHLFRDENSFGFFKRPSWSPDGSFLAVPAGRLRATADKQFTEGAFLFKRGDWNKPVAHLPFPGEATMAVRFCPVLFQLKEGTDSNPSIDLPYQMVFAVASSSSVAIYTTQDTVPLAFLGMLHYAPITDLAWSPDGLTLVCSSQDGYCSIAQFEAGELGEPLPLDLLPPHLVDKSDAGEAAAIEAAAVSADAPPIAPVAAAPREEVPSKLPETMSRAVCPGAKGVAPQAAEQSDEGANAKRKRIVPEAVGHSSGGADGRAAVKRIAPQAIGQSGEGAGSDGGVKRIVPETIDNGTAAPEPTVKRIVPEAVGDGEVGTKPTAKRITPQPVREPDEGAGGALTAVKSVPRAEGHSDGAPSDGKIKSRRIVPEAVPQVNLAFDKTTRTEAAAPQPKVQPCVGGIAALAAAMGNAAAACGAKTVDGIAAQQREGGRGEGCRATGEGRKGRDENVPPEKKRRISPTPIA